MPVPITVEIERALGHIVICNHFTARIEDLRDIEVRAWPDCLRATAEQLEERHRRFPDGVFGAFLEGRLVGMCTSQIVDYHKGIATQVLESYLPRFGQMDILHNPNGNTLHFMSAGVVPEVRCCGVWRRFVEARLRLANELGLAYAMVDLRMPSYETYATQFPGVSPEEYSRTKVNGRFAEPYMAFFDTQGFCYERVVPSSYEDSASGNVWVYMVKALG